MFDKYIEALSHYDIYGAILKTLLQVGIAITIAVLIGLPIGILVVLTDKNGIMPNKIIHNFTNIIINIGRSIPFLILIVFLIPFVRYLVGTGIGLVSFSLILSIAAIPFVARLIETSLKEVDRGVIEAAKVMGASTMQIIIHVYIKESLPSLIRNLSIALITIIGYSAVSGTIAGGGLGEVAVNIGHNQNKPQVIIDVVLIIIILVSIIHYSLELVAKRINKK